MESLFVKEGRRISFVTKHQNGPCVGNCFLAYIVGFFRALGGTPAIGKASRIHTYTYCTWHGVR